MKIETGDMEDPDLNVSSLIDMVFLLLVYFMAVATFVATEGDLGIKLPGMLQQADAVDLPDEQIIEIKENGAVFLNDKE
jgi:biopolymer transport protein ExbD